MATIKQLEKDLKVIKKRNEEVEASKAWEVSFTRRVLVALFTYLATAIYLRAIDIELPWLNAIPPAIAFLLSMLTMPWFKKAWMKRFLKD